MRQTSKRIPESGTPIPLSPKKLPAGGLVCLPALKTLGNFRAPTRGAAAVFLSRPSSSFPTASSRYWSRALSARKWSNTRIAARITRPRRSRSVTARRSEGLSALGHQRLRELREAQQEGAARGGGRRPADRGLCRARRHAQREEEINDAIRPALKHALEVPAAHRPAATLSNVKGKRDAPSVADTAKRVQIPATRKFRSSHKRLNPGQRRLGTGFL